MVDSNHRRHSQQIYSLSPLATREIPHIQFLEKTVIGAGRRTRTPDLLITKRVRSIKNGPFGPFFHIFAPNKNRRRPLVSTVSVYFFRVWVTVWVGAFRVSTGGGQIFAVSVTNNSQKLHRCNQRYSDENGNPVNTSGTYRSAQYLGRSVAASTSF